MLDNDRPHLMPMPEPFDGQVENSSRVSSTCPVVIARNGYSVPCELAEQRAKSPSAQLLSRTVRPRI